LQRANISQVLLAQLVSILSCYSSVRARASARCNASRLNLKIDFS